MELVVANANGSTNVIRISDRPEAPKSDFETSLSPKNKDKLAGYGITAAGDTMTVEAKQYVWVDGQRSSQREFTFGPDVAGILPLTRGVPVLGGAAEIFVKYKDGTEKYIFVTSDKDRAPPK